MHERWLLSGTLNLHNQVWFQKLDIMVLINFERRVKKNHKKTHMSW